MSNNYQIEISSFPAVNGWKPIARPKISLTESGYFGVLFRNEITGRLVLAHRGTECDNFLSLVCADDLVNDDEFIGRSLIPDQYTSSVMPFVIDLASSGIPIHQLTHTGHSLGAVLAEIAAHQYDSYAVTFDSPGSKHFVELLSLTAQDNKIISFQAGPHFVNTAEEHIGTLYRIYPPYVNRGSEFLTALSQHSIAGILAEFNPETGEPYVTHLLKKGEYDELDGLFIDASFVRHPHLWWDIVLSAKSSQEKIAYAINHLGNISGTASTEAKIIGDETANYIWGDSMDSDVIEAKGGADRIDSYGGNDVLDGGADGDTFRILSIPNARGARVIKNPENSDALEWERYGDSKEWSIFAVNGLATKVGENEYRLIITDATNIVATFRLVTTPEGLWLTQPGNDLNTILIEGWTEGNLSIYLNPQSIAVESGTNLITGGITQSPEIIEGTAKRDIVQADQQTCSAGGQWKFEDIIHTYAGDDIIAADNSNSVGLSNCDAGNDIIDAGPGNDRVEAGLVGTAKITTDKNIVYLGAGDDYANGSNNKTPNGYQDLIYGGEGIDTIYRFKYASGGPGEDKLYADFGSQADGGPDADNLIALSSDISGNSCETAPITLNGDEGADRLESSNCGVTHLNGGDGVNKYIISLLTGRTGTTIITPSSDEYTSHSTPLYFIDLVGEHPILNGNQFTMVFQPDNSLMITQKTTATEIQATPPFSIIIKNFYDGMFGITGVAGASTLPAEPWIPGFGSNPSSQHTIYLPLLRRSGTAQAQGASSMAHPVAQAHPEHVAYSAPAASATAGLLMMGVVARAAPLRLLRPVQRAFERAQRELDIVRIRVEQALIGFKARIGN